MSPDEVRPARVIASAAGLTALLILAMAVTATSAFSQLKAKGLRRSGAVLSAVVHGPAGQPVRAPAAAPTGFSPQIQLGFASGDGWEPAIAADRFGRVYVLYPQYLGVPGCAACASPTMVLQVSTDRGQTWGSPRVAFPAGAANGQWDAQIVVDPVDGRTVYASWLQNGKSDTVVAKSTDFGVNWTVVTADRTNAGTDKPILAVRGQDVYVVFNHAQKIWAAYSHDGGQTFTQTQINPNGKLGWSLAGGGAVLPNGTVLYGWAGYEQNGGARGNVNLFVSRSTDGGRTWTNTVLEVSKAPPDCTAYNCGWAYLGAQMVLAADDGGQVYALWNANQTPRGLNRLYFARSADGGVSWTARTEVSTAPASAQHAFPAITAGAAGDVRISWMDTRAGSVWNTYVRRSTNGGATWTAEADISTQAPGYVYSQPSGFSFPFGDYYELAIDDQGGTQVVWGEGLNYDTPGQVWFSRGP